LLAGLCANVLLQTRTVSASSNLPKYIDEYAVPTLNSAPLAITVDKQGIVWFTESNASKLARFDPANQSFREYTAPGVGDMWGVTVDKGGYVWLTQYSGKGSVNPGGAIVAGGQGRLLRFDPRNLNFTFVDIPTVGSFPFRLITDERSRVWFTEFLGNKIGVYDQSSNQLVEYDIPVNSSGPADLTFDQQGSLWFTEAYAGGVAEFSIENRSFTGYSFRNSTQTIFSPVGIALDNEGNVWVADHGGNWIGRLDPLTKQLARYSTHLMPSDLTIPNGLIIDGKGKIWFCEHWGNTIGYLDPSTWTMVEFPIPTGPISTVLWIALAPNGDVWFTEWSANKIGVVHANLPVPLSIRVSQTKLRLQVGDQTSISLLTKISQDISGNGTFSYSWASYDPDKEISVTFSPEHPSLSGLADTPAQAQLKLSDTVRPSNYSLGLGIDAGTVLVWSLVQIEVSSPSHPAPQFIESPVIVLLGLVLGTVVVSVLILRKRFRGNPINS
jgi:virginiamycin B lyase